MLEEKLSDKTWTDTQDAEFIKGLEGIKNVIQNISSNMFIMLDLFQQYTDAIYQSPVFADVVGKESEQDGKVNPTQTPPAPANRAEKRAAAKSGLIVPDKTLIVP